MKILRIIYTIIPFTFTVLWYSAETDNETLERVALIALSILLIALLLVTVVVLIHNLITGSDQDQWCEVRRTEPDRYVSAVRHVMGQQIKKLDYTFSPSVGWFLLLTIVVLPQLILYLLASV